MGTARYCYVYFKFYKGPTSSTVTPTATNYIKGFTITLATTVTFAPIAKYVNIIYKMCFTPMVVMHLQVHQVGLGHFRWEHQV